MTTINDLIKNGRVMDNNVEIVGYIGVIGSGKSHRAEQLIKDGFHPVAFADSLREMCYKIIGWQPSSDEEYDNFKKGNWYIDSQAGFLNGRLLLQNIGQAMRDINENFWVDALVSRIAKLS